MTIVDEASGEVPIVPDNMYELTVVNVVTGVREGPDRFNPEIVDAPIVHISTALGGTADEEGDPIVLRTTMNLKFSRGGQYQPSTLFLFADAFGVAPEKGKSFDTDWLKGTKARGMVRTEKEGTWPKVIPESLIPMPKANGVKVPTATQEGAEPPLADALAEAAALASWTESVRAIGYTTQEIIDHSQTKYQRGLNELTAVEREALAKELGVQANPAPF